MRKKHGQMLRIIGSALGGIIISANTMAQEADYTLAHEDIFGKLRRPQVSFSHENHSVSLEESGCGSCHHLQHENTGRLVYVEGEELSCTECHGSRRKNNAPALREAFHGSCTVCHRRLVKTDSPKRGPTTCGGCHRKQS